MSSSKLMNWIMSGWRFAALTTFNVLIFFILINVLCFYYLKSKDTTKDEINFLYSIVDYSAYSKKGLTIQVDSNYVNAVLGEYLTFLQGEQPEFIYHPATEFQHAPTTTPNYNLDKSLPLSDFNVRPSYLNFNTDSIPRYLIFCFGGSTTLGVLVNDKHTWPYQLQVELNKKLPGQFGVINFGSASFNATQETNLFIYLLKQGYRPSLSLFLDGINVGPEHDGSEFSSRIAQRFNTNEIEISDLPKFIKALPAIRLIEGRKLPSLDIFKTDNYDMARIETSAEYNSMIANRFIQNAQIRGAMADLYGVKTISFLQPNAYINSPSHYLSDFSRMYLESNEGKNMHDNHLAIYTDVLNSNAGFKDLSYLFDNYNNPAIVDLIHYSPSFNLYLANEIKSLLPDTLPHYRYDNVKSTGRPFVPSL
jgi:hypothetical protein